MTCNVVEDPSVLRRRRERQPVIWFKFPKYRMEMVQIKDSTFLSHAMLYFGQYVEVKQETFHLQI